MIEQAHDRFIEAAVWHGPLESAAAILAEHPAIATHSIYAAAILGDTAGVRGFIARDPASATRPGGPKNWDALTHLCFSKYLRLEPARTHGFLDAASALLDAGATPNAGFYNGEARVQSEWECALYGAAGVAHHPELTQLLLDRGADPNDGEVGYHAPETMDNRTMHVLVESGKLTQDTIRLMLARKMNWHDDNGVAWLLDHGADANYTSHWGSRPLHDALAHGTPLHYFERLLDHGADPALLTKDGVSSVAAAARLGRADVLDLFERRGFSVPLDGDDAFLAACARADEATARRIAGADPGIVRRIEMRHPTLLIDFAGSADANAVRLLLDLGFDIAVARTEPPWSRGLNAMHEATGHCRLETVELLIARGAPLAATHERSGRTPLDVALISITTQSEFTPHPNLLPIARALLASGAPFNETSMTLAAAICLDRGTDVARLSRTASRDDKQLALAAAAFYGKVDGLRTALAMGADVDALSPGLEHAPPLHNAVTSGSLAVVKTLANAGARLDTKDLAYQLTPLEWAEWYARNAMHDSHRKRYSDIADYLRERRQ
jgi:ankyrin repeat protein